MKELSNLLECIHDAVKKEAEKHPIYKKTGGEVQISFTPRTKAADDWLGGLSSFSEEVKADVGVLAEGTDVVKYDFTRTIFLKPEHSSNFDHPSVMSKAKTVEIAEREGTKHLSFMRMDISVTGAEHVIDDSALVDAALEALIDWLDEPYEVVALI